MARTLVLDTITDPDNSTGNANITLSPDSTTTLPKVDINSGAIDNTTLGVAVPSSVAATTLSTTGNATVGGTLGVTGNTTLSGSANNIGTVTAGTIGSAVVYPDGHLIKTHMYTDGTGISAYGVSSTTATCMTDTVAVSAVSGRTYSIEFQGNMGISRNNTADYTDIYAFWGIYEPTSDIVPGSTSLGTSRNQANVRINHGGTNTTSSILNYGQQVITYSWVAGSTATQYFCIGGGVQSLNTTLSLNEMQAFAPANLYYFILREYQGNCLTYPI